MRSGASAGADANGQIVLLHQVLQLPCQNIIEWPVIAYGVAKDRFTVHAMHDDALRS